MVIPPRLTPRAGPNVWTGDTMLPAHWMLPVGAGAAAELLAVAASLGGARPERPQDAPMPRLGPVLREAADRLENGAGFALLRGLAADRFSAETAKAALLAVAAHLGAALPQDADGTLVAPPQCSAGQLLAEPADAVAMFCLRALPEGGAVLLHSAASLHNELMRRNRAALAALHQPLPHRCRNSSAGPMMHPVFCSTGGAFVGRYDRAAVVDALLDPAQAAAVAALDEAATAPGQALALPLRAGDLLLLNPHLVWRRGAAAPGHADDAVGGPRMLGVWLATRTSRALPESFRPIFGETAAGARRGGVPIGPSPGMVGG
jgi:TfdA family taurine catabolism dioxygenase TauD